MKECPFCQAQLTGTPESCPSCGQSLNTEQSESAGVPEPAMTPPPTPPASEAGGNGESGEPQRPVLPFEDPANGFFKGLFDTIKLVLFQPTHCFSHYRMNGPIGRPMVFAITVGWFATAVGLLWGLLFNASIMTVIAKYIPQNELPMGKLMPQMVVNTAASVASLFLAPVLIVIGLFVAAGIYHLFLLMVSGARKGFESTFNVVSYTIAAKLFIVLPFCGGTIAWIYGLVLAAIGLTGAHETEGWKGAFAVIMPLVLCCCCAALFVVMFSAGIAGLAANQH